MNCRIASGLQIILLCGVVVVLIPACSPFGLFNGPFEYVIKVANYGTHGVILRDFHASRGGFGVDDTWGIYPGIPGVAGDFKRFEHLVGYPHSLPDALIITWQLAKLSNCKDIDVSKALPPMEDYDNKIHTRREDCTWPPIEDKVFQQRIDMAAIRASEAYQRVGEVHGLYPTYLIIRMIFNEGSLVVEATNGSRSGV